LNIKMNLYIKRLATGWTVRGSNPGGGEIFRNCPDRPWGPPCLPRNGYRVFPGGKERPGHDADPSPPSSAEVLEEQSYNSTPPMARTACTREHFTFFFTYSFSSLSYDRSKASSKASSPHSAIQSFLSQMRVSSPFLKVIQ
jgi:hypothetical protein